MRDHIADVNRSELYKLQSDMVIPDFVKEAELQTPEEIKKVHHSHFADPYNKKFPIHTKADTWLSTVFFHKHAATYEPWQKEAISKKLVDAVKFWDLEDQFKTLPKMEEKTASHGIKIEYRVDGVVRNSVEIETRNDLEKVANDLISNWRNYNYSTRKDVANQLLSVPMTAELPLKTVSALEKSAGMQKAALDTALATVEVYKSWMDHAKTKHLIPQLNDAAQMLFKVAENNIVDEDAIEKLASIIDNVDYLAGLHRYSNAPCAPEHNLRGVSVSQAGTASTHMLKLANGSVVFTSKVLKDGEKIKGFAKEALGLDLQNLGDLETIDKRDAQIIVKAFPQITESD